MLREDTRCKCAGTRYISGLSERVVEGEIQPIGFWSWFIAPSFEAAEYGYFSTRYRSERVDEYHSLQSYNSINELQKKKPQLAIDKRHKGLRWWYYKDQFWITNEKYDSDDMKYLIEEKSIKAREKVSKAKRTVERHESRSLTVKGGNRRIPQAVADRVWKRDGGKCVSCSSRENLEFDHIIPFSKGGANTYRNIQLLCENCNREKSDEVG